MVELKDLFKKYLNYRYNNPLKDEANERIFKIFNYTFPENEDDSLDIIITGTMIYGGYDEYQLLMNKSNGDLQKIGGNAVVRPYYFLFYLPSKYNIGIALFHKYGKDGAMSQFKVDFQEYLKTYINKNKDNRRYSISFKATLPKGLLDKYIDEGCVKKMKVLTFVPMDDICDAYNSKDKPTQVTKETTYSIRGNSLPINKNSLKKLIHGNISKKDFINIPDIEDADEIKFELDIGEITRTISVEKENMVPYIDISEEIKNHKNYYEAIDIEAKKLLILLNNQIYNK